MYGKCYTCFDMSASCTAELTNMKATKVAITECSHVTGVHNCNYKSDIHAVIYELCIFIYFGMHRTSYMSMHVCQCNSYSFLE